jgi:hypothetical protein
MYAFDEFTFAPDADLFDDDIIMEYARIFRALTASPSRTPKYAKIRTALMHAKIPTPPLTAYRHI